MDHGDAAAVLGLVAVLLHQGGGFGEPRLEFALQPESGGEILRRRDEPSAESEETARIALGVDRGHVRLDIRAVRGLAVEVRHLLQLGELARRVAERERLGPRRRTFGGEALARDAEFDKFHPDRPFAGGERIYAQIERGDERLEYLLLRGFEPGGILREEFRSLRHRRLDPGLEFPVWVAGGEPARDFVSGPFVRETRVGDCEEAPGVNGVVACIARRQPVDLVEASGRDQLLHRRGELFPELADDRMCDDVAHDCGMRIGVPDRAVDRGGEPLHGPEDVFIRQIRKILRLEHAAEHGDLRLYLRTGQDLARRIHDFGIVPVAFGKRLAYKFALHGIARAQRVDGRDNAGFLFDEALQLLVAPLPYSGDVVVFRTFEREVGVGEVATDAVAQVGEHSAACEAQSPQVKPGADGVFVESGPVGDPGGGGLERTGVGELHLAEGADGDLCFLGVVLEHVVGRNPGVLAAGGGVGHGGRDLPGEIGEAREERLLGAPRGIRAHLDSQRLAETRGIALGGLDRGGIGEMHPGETAQDGGRAGRPERAHLGGERLAVSAGEERRFGLGGERPESEIRERAVQRLRGERRHSAVGDSASDRRVVAREALFRHDRHENIRMERDVGQSIDLGQVGEVHPEHFRAVQELVEPVHQPRLVADGNGEHDLRDGLHLLRRALVRIDVRRRGALDSLAHGAKHFQRVIARGAILQRGHAVAGMHVAERVPDRGEVEARNHVDHHDLALDFVARLRRDALEIVGLGEERGALGRCGARHCAEPCFDLLVRVGRVFAVADL